MINKLYKYYLGRTLCFVAVSLLLLTVGSCNKTLDVKSTHLATEELQWNSLTDTRASLMGTYGLFKAALSDNNAHWLWSELRAGDFVSYSRSDLKAIHDGELSAAFPIMEQLKNWRRFYAVINSANILIERAPEVFEKDRLYTEQNLKMDIAQARVLRAFAYFYMVRIWGDVPLITSSHDNGSFKAKPRTDKDVILAFVEKEILKATEDLPYKYGVSPTLYYGETEGRWVSTLINKNSAFAILSHVAAWRGNYINVDAYSEFVMNNYTSSGISYVDINDLVNGEGFFNDRDWRQIVSFSFVDAHGESTVSGHIEALTLAQPLVTKQFPEIYVPKDSISVIFDDPLNRDARFGIDTISGLPKTNYFINYSGATPIFSKIKAVRSGGSNHMDIFSSAIVFSRLEDITLLRAEALAVLGRLGDATILLNRIRNSRALSSVNPLGADDLIEAIFDERRRELMGEGHRWYDLVRYNKIKQTNPGFNKLIDEGGIYWPIADEVLKNNSTLTQNPYWN